MAHKNRKATADRDAHCALAGLVEIDESFFGRKSSGKRGRGVVGKGLVIIAIPTWINPPGDEKPGFAHTFMVKDASADAIEAN